VSRLPVLLDLEVLLNRLAREERSIQERLAALEAEVRQFEDIERPAYEGWMRLELGPRIAILEEVLARIHEKRILVHRLNELIETRGLHPREALYVLRNLDRVDPDNDAENRDDPSASAGSAGPGTRKKGQAWDEEELEARRQAKREAKREARREKKAESKAQKQETSSKAAPSLLSRRLTSLYRDLAKKLHPDSPLRTRSIPESRLLGLWMEVQKAYDSGNLERLSSIATWLSAESGEELEQESALTYSERLGQLRALRRACRNLEEKINRLGDHPAWGFSRAKPQQRKKLRQLALRSLDQEIADAQEILGELEDLLESVGPPRAPREKPEAGRGGRKRR